VEAKISTLSIQHHGAFFYIHFTIVVDAHGKQEVYCELDTPSFQVLSKKGPHLTSQRRKPAADLLSPFDAVLGAVAVVVVVVAVAVVAVFVAVVLLLWLLLLLLLFYRSRHRLLLEEARGLIFFHF